MMLEGMHDSGETGGCGNAHVQAHNVYDRGIWQNVGEVLAPRSLRGTRAAEPTGAKAKRKTRRKEA